MKKVKLLFLMIFTILCMAGCTRQEYNVSITDQNGVDFQIRVVADRDSYNLLSTFNVDLTEIEKNGVDGTGSAIDRVNPLFQEKAMQFKTLGFDITELNDAVELGFIAKKSYLTIEEFNEEIKKMCENNMSGLNLDIQYTDTKNHKEYKAYGTLKYITDEDLGFDDPIIKEYFDKQYETSLLTCKVTIMVPSMTKITATDGQNGAGGILEWTASYDSGEKEVHIISEYHDNTMYYIAVLAVLVVGGIAGFFIMRAMKFRKEKEHSAIKEEYEESK